MPEQRCSVILGRRKEGKRHRCNRRKAYTEHPKHARKVAYGCSTAAERQFWLTIKCTYLLLPGF